MKIEININLEAAISQALAPEKLGPILDKHITEAITSAISDATGYRSEFRKALTEQVTAALPHGLRVDEVAKFQHVLNQSVRSVVQCANQDAVTTALEKAVKDVMPDVPPVVKLSELMKAAREGFHKEEHEAFYAHFEESEHGGGGRLYLDGDERPGSNSFSRSSRDREDCKYSAAHCLAFNKDGVVYSLRLDSKDVTPASRPDIVGCFDSLLMAMYVGRTRLEIDMDTDDVESAAEAQYD